jgi:hypothetical protein
MGRRSTSARRSSTTSTSWRTLEARRVFVDETARCPRGPPWSSPRTASPGGPRGGEARVSSRRSTPPARWSPRCTARPCASPTRDYDILLIGHEGHEEVVGTWGRRPSTSSSTHPDDVAGVGPRPREGRLAVPDHPVGRRDLETVRKLREKFPQLIDPPSDDICYATQNRQLAVKQMARMRPDDRRRLAQLLQLRAPGRGRPGARARGPGTWSTTPARSTRPGSTGSSRSASPRAPRCPRSSCARCSSTSPSAATRRCPAGQPRRSRSRSCSRCPTRSAVTSRPL